MKCTLVVLQFNDTSPLVGHFVSSPREREKKVKKDSNGDEREGQGRRRTRPVARQDSSPDIAHFVSEKF